MEFPVITMRIPHCGPFSGIKILRLAVKGSSGAPEKQPLAPGTKVNLFHKRFAPTVVNQSYTPPTGIPEELRFLTLKVPMQGIPYDKKVLQIQII